MTWEEAREQAQRDVEAVANKLPKNKKTLLCSEMLAVRILLAKERLRIKNGGNNGAKRETTC